jgi:transcriptional regulator with XRE-family HTH domain
MTAGKLLRHWRDLRKMSQLALANEAGISARHLSFVESGRSNPSREMVLTLAEALDVPLRERNALLQAAGFAAHFSQSGVDSAELAGVLGTLEAVLERMEPFPCVVLDSQYTVLRGNAAAMRLIGTFVDPSLLNGPPNLMRLLFAPQMRPHIANWEQIAPMFIQELHRAALAGHGGTRALLEEVLEQPGVPARWRAADLDHRAPVVVPLVLRKGELELSLFTLLATLGTPLEVTLQELRVETYLPSDAKTAAALRRLAAAQT